MNDDQLEHHLAATGGARPTGDAARLVPALLDLYALRGAVVGGALPALHRACECAAVCWRRLGDGAKAPARGPDDHAPADKGAIFLPWVGPRYRPGGICVIGLNIRYRGGGWGLGVEQEIATDPVHGQEQALRAGKRAHGSAWSKSTMRDVFAVRKARGDLPVDAAEDGAALAECLMVSARVQAIKCSPVGGRSSPTPEMATECPPRFLQDELRVLRPGTLLAYGRSAGAALRRVGGQLDVTASGKLQRGRLRAAWGDAEVFLLVHPGHGGWHPCHRDLVRVLAADRSTQQGREIAR